MFSQNENHAEIAVTFPVILIQLKPISILKIRPFFFLFTSYTIILLMAQETPQKCLA